MSWEASLGSPAAKLRLNPIRDVDWNGDGFADLVMVDTSQTREFIAFVPGGKSGLDFDSVRYRRAPGGPAITLLVDHVGDVDGDGFSDIVVSNESYVEGALVSVFLYRGHADGPADIEDLVLEDPDVATPYLKRYGAEAGAAGDLNGDGFSDVFVWRPLAHLAIHYGSATGLKAKPDLVLKVDQQGNDLTAVLPVGDMDGDGFDDVLIGFGKDTSYITRLHHGSAAGLEEAGVLMPTAAGLGFDHGPHSMSSFDIDDDGIGDVIRPIELENDPAAPASSVMRWYKGAANGFFDESRGLVVPPNDAVSHPRRMGQSAGDINGDGVTDAVAPWADGSKNEAKLYRVEGILGWTGGADRMTANSRYSWVTQIDPALIDASVSPTFASTLACPGDIDGDGFQDCVQFGESQFFAWRGSPTGLQLAEQKLMRGQGRSIATSAPLASVLLR